eukprot:174163_1
MAQRLYDNYVSHYGCAPTKTKYLISFAKKYDIKIKFSKAKQIIRTNLNSLSKLVEKPRTRTNNDKVQSLFYVGEKIEYNTDEIIIIEQINDKNCSTKCQTALQRSENVSQ